MLWPLIFFQRMSLSVSTRGNCSFRATSDTWGGVSYTSLNTSVTTTTTSTDLWEPPDHPGRLPHLHVLPVAVDGGHLLPVPEEKSHILHHLCTTTLYLCWKSFTSSPPEFAKRNLIFLQESGVRCLV